MPKDKTDKEVEDEEKEDDKDAGSTKEDDSTSDDSDDNNVSISQDKLNSKLADAKRTGRAQSEKTLLKKFSKMLRVAFM